MRSTDELCETFRNQLAIGLRSCWIEAAAGCLKERHPDLDSWGMDRLLQELFGQFLLCDLNVAGQGILPLDVQVGGSLCVCAMLACTACAPSWHG